MKKKNFFAQYKQFTFFLILAVVIILIAVFAPVVSGGVDPLKGSLDEALLAPSKAHIFGTDKMGRDIFARVIYGARASLTATFGVVALIFFIGTTLGVIAGYFGGMRQRVGIAMGMSYQPKLLLADEPTSALDVTTQAQIVRQMMELRDDYGTSIIVVTHNLGIAAYMSDYIVVMKDGKMEDQGTREYILHETQNAYTRSLLGAVPSVGGERYV